MEAHQFINSIDPGRAPGEDRKTADTGWKFGLRHAACKRAVWGQEPGQPVQPGQAGSRAGGKEHGAWKFQLCELPSFLR